jgi:hypothetical protein
MLIEFFLAFLANLDFFGIFWLFLAFLEKFGFFRKFWIIWKILDFI